jgi:hypothetical protein
MRDFDQPQHRGRSAGRSGKFFAGRKLVIGKTVFACAAFLAVLAAVLAAPAHADTTDDLLKILRDKGILTEQEYETLVKRKANEEATHIATPPASPGCSPVPAIDSKAQKGLALVGFSETGVTNVPNRQFHVAAVRLPREAPAQLLGEVQVRAIDVVRFIFVSGACAEK